MLVIAVFGTSDPKAFPNAPVLADQIGHELARTADRIVLTGGADPGGDESVKNRALVGPAARAGRSWIGVLRGSKLGERHIGSGLVLETTLGHRRNYLEACLCDAAIALPGDRGTLSEAVSTLCLHKPVVFVGDEWQQSEFKLLKLYEAAASEPLDKATRDDWIKRANERLAPDLRSAIGRLILQDVVADNLLDAHQCIAVLSTETWSQAVVEVQRLLSRSAPAHWFPKLVGDPHEQLRNDYEAFVL
jgi:predicted Rossmann-fold nucleotide-binding protein